MAIEDSEPIFLHNTVAQDATLPYQVWYQNEQQFKDILRINSHTDLECRNQIFPQDTQDYEAVLPNQV